MTIRGPLITPVNRRRVPQQPTIGVNLQSTTLKPAAAAQAPFNRTDWPNPTRRPITLSHHFLITTSFFDSPVPQIKWDFQNPIIKRRVQQPVVLPNLVLNTLFVTPPIPKVRQEFQNPVIARRVLQQQVLPTLPPYLAFVGTDTTPDQFSFGDKFNVATSTVITSDPVTITGIDAPSPITVSGGTYDINGSGTFVGTAGSVVNGDTVRARHTSSASNSTATNTVVTIGGVSDTFTSVTAGAANPSETGTISVIMRNRLLLQ